MTVAEKLQEVSLYAKNDKILLFCEGMFWKAYQEAAYMFVKKIRPYQVNCNYIKKIQSDVLSLGFPKPSADKILSGLDYSEDDGRIVIKLSDVSFNESDYSEWRFEVIPQSVPSRKPSSDTLLVFKHSYDLVLYFYQLNKNVSREYKFSLCENIKAELHELLMSVYFANESDLPSEKTDKIRKTLEFLASVKIRIRLLYDLKQISIKQFSLLAERMTDLKDELTMWLKTL